MSRVKAHIVFDEGHITKPEDRSKMLDKVKKTAKISDINQERFDLYGVLTGTIDESNLDKVRQIPGVAGVEVDEEKYIQ
jgi:hypothetical protein